MNWKHRDKGAGDCAPKKAATAITITSFFVYFHFVFDILNIYRGVFLHKIV